MYYTDAQPLVSCTGVTCEYGAVCQVINNEAQCKCPMNCPAEDTASEPVCGSDGMTYGSRCQLELYACREQRDVYMQHRGQCQGEYNIEVNVKGSEVNVKVSTTQRSMSRGQRTEVNVKVNTIQRSRWVRWKVNEYNTEVKVSKTQRSRWVKHRDQCPVYYNTEVNVKVRTTQVNVKVNKTHRSRSRRVKHTGQCVKGQCQSEYNTRGQCRDENIDIDPWKANQEGIKFKFNMRLAKWLKRFDMNHFSESCLK